MRIRTIKPEFWKSQTLSMLPAETRLLAIALLNYADDEGYFFAHPALIRGELMPFAESHATIPGMLKELEEVEYIRIGEDAQRRKVGLVVNFKKHQRVDKPQRSKLAGTVEFHDCSPSIPGIFPESSGNNQEPFLAGMEGNGKGMEEEGNGVSSPDKPGGTSAAASSMSEAPTSDAKPTDAPPTQPDLAKKKKGGAAGDDDSLPPAMRRRAQAEQAAKKKKGAAEPEFPEGMDVGHQHALSLWWHYKRERHEGYKPSGWQALIKQQLRFPPEQVLASVEASMAANYAGLFTDRHAAAVYPAGKPERVDDGFFGGAASAREAPKGWRTAMAVLFGDDWETHYPAFGTMPPADQRQVRAWLEKKGPGAFECPTPCDWREIWTEVFGDMPCPDTWDEVCRSHREGIVDRIEAKKEGIVK